MITQRLWVLCQCNGVQVCTLWADKMKELRWNDSQSPSSLKICDSQTLCIIGFVAFLFSGWSGAIWGTKHPWEDGDVSKSLHCNFLLVVAFCFCVSAEPSCCLATFLHIGGKIMRNLRKPQTLFCFHYKVFSHNYSAYSNIPAYLMFFRQIKNCEADLANQRDNLVAKV